MKITPEKLQELMKMAEAYASSASNSSEGAVDGNEVYLETLAGEINKFFITIDQNQILKNSWWAWLKYTGFSEIDWEFDVFILQWRNNKFSSQGKWIESWIKSIESITGEELNFE